MAKEVKNRQYPRVLVISNNSFSKTNSNGRTLGNFFKGWPKDKVAQFFLISDGPDYEICDNYYCMTDKSALRAFFTISKPIRSIFNPSKNYVASINKKSQKTSLKMLCRSLMWRFCRWNNKDFNFWIQSFSPEVILFTNGDSFFMLDIARILSKRYHIPLVVFNTEGYYFFKNNYFKDSLLSKLLFPLYKLLYHRSFNKLINQASFSIYGNSRLKEDYDNEFHKKGIVLYTCTSIDYKEKRELSEPPVFSYLGNFGYSRYETLIELGKMLHDIDEKYSLNVYGDASDKVKQAFRKCPYIDYKGFVGYDKVKEVMHQSDILFHVENQALHWQESLKYGFSTKIADSLGSGSLFCLYSSPDIACAKYIRETGTSIYASDLDSLKKQLIEVLGDTEKRLTLIEQQRKVALANHNMDRNAEMFRNRLFEIAKEG